MCERNIDWLPLTCPQLGTWLATQECALTGNHTGNPTVHRLELNPLSHISQGYFNFLIQLFIYLYLETKLIIIFQGLILHTDIIITF